MEAIIVIVVVLGLIALYVWATIWLFQKAGAAVFIGTAALVTTAFIGVHGHHAFRTYTRGWRGLFLVPAAYLYVLIGADIVVLEAMGCAAWLPSGLADELLMRLGPVVAGSGQAQLTGWIAEHLWHGAQGWQLIASAMAIKAVLLGPLLIGARGTGGTSVEGLEPASLAYFERQAWQDLSGLHTSFMDGLQSAWKKLSDGAPAVSGLGCLLWSIGLPVVLAAAVSLVLGAVVVSVIAAGVGLGIAASWVVARYIRLAVRLMERAVIYRRAGYAKCPHAGCHKPIARAVVHCPECQRPHGALEPGPYGLFTRSCACGRALPHLFLVPHVLTKPLRLEAKGDLGGSCPHCRGELPGQLFAENLHLPVFGGAASGKSMWMTAALWDLERAPGWHTTLITEAQRDRWNERWKPAFESGRRRLKTQVQPPDALLISARRDGGLPVSVYLYDPSGESFTQADGLRDHDYLEHADGAVLVIDALSIRDLAAAWRDSTGETELPADTSHANTLDAAKTMVKELTRRDPRRADSKLPLRLAVVVTKADRAGVLERMGVTAFPNTALDAANASDAVHAYLSKRERGLVNYLDNRFAEVRWHVATAEGTGDDQGFQPQGVLPALSWLLRGHGALEKPLMGRVLRRGSEAALAAGILLAFALPLLAVPTGVSWARERIEAPPPIAAPVHATLAPDQIQQLPGGAVVFVDAQPAGLFAADEAGTLWWLGDTPRTLQGFQGRVRDVAVSPDGTTVAAVGTDPRGVAVWSDADDAPRWISLDGWIGLAVRFDDDATLRVVEPRGVWRVPLGRGRKKRLRGATPLLTGAALADQGPGLCTANINGQVGCAGATTWTSGASAGALAHLHADPALKRLLVMPYSDATPLMQWDGSRERQVLKPRGRVVSQAVHGSRDLSAYGLSDGTVVLASHELGLGLPHAVGSGWVSVTWDGDELVTGTQDGALRWWSLGSDQLQFEAALPTPAGGRLTPCTDRDDARHCQQGPDARLIWTTDQSTAEVAASMAGVLAQQGWFPDVGPAGATHGTATHPETPIALRWELERIQRGRGDEPSVYSVALFAESEDAR